MDVANRTIKGKVVDENDKPLAGVDISISGIDGRESVKSDKNGRFILTDVPNKAINIQAWNYGNSNPESSGSVTVSKTQKETTIIMVKNRY